MENFFQRNFKIFCLVSLLHYFITVQQDTTTTTPTRKEKSFDESSPRSRDIGVNKEVKTSKVESKEIVTVSSIFCPMTS